jgi:RHS repeat-associated protein
MVRLKNDFLAKKNPQRNVSHKKPMKRKQTTTVPAKRYEYDALGRRKITQDIAGNTMRTVYDGRSFEVIREGETFRNGRLTTQFARSGATVNHNGDTSDQPQVRYRWIGDDYYARIADDGYELQSTRSSGRSVTLYGNSEAIAVSYASSTSGRSLYLGKDIMGSVRTATSDGGSLEDRYEYDAFGKPYAGDLGGLMNLGYTGKPYDTATGMYNYGYRDYRPAAARFTTVDPIRDGNNWFAYVNNDPVNLIDLWGLDVMFSVYIRGSGKISSTYIPFKPDGSPDISNIKKYTFSASNNISTKPTQTILRNGSLGEYYYPQPFPTGIHTVYPSRQIPDDHKDKQYLGDVFIGTSANQTVNTYGNTSPASNAQPTGKQQDYGYGYHYSEKGITAGCLGAESQEDANRFAALSDQALASKNGISSLIVTEPGKNK